VESKELRNRILPKDSHLYPEVELPEVLEGLQENDDLLESFELDNSVELLQDMHGSYLLTDETAVENVLNHQRENVVIPSDILLLDEINDLPNTDEVIQEKTHRPPRRDPAGIDITNILPEGSRRRVHFNLPIRQKQSRGVKVG